MRRANVESRGGTKQWFCVGLVVRGDTLIIRVRSGVLSRQLWDKAVGEDDERVASAEIAAIDALPHQVRAGEREVVVDDVQLEEATAHLGQIERRPSHAKTLRVTGHPERRVAGREDEFGGRRRRCASTGEGGVATAGESRQQREDSPSEEQQAHR